MSIHPYTLISARLHIYSLMFTNACMDVSIYTHMRIYTCMYMYSYTYINPHAYTHVNERTLEKIPMKEM